MSATSSFAARDAAFVGASQNYEPVHATSIDRRSRRNIGDDDGGGGGGGGGNNDDGGRRTAFEINDEEGGMDTSTSSSASSSRALLTLMPTSANCRGRLFHLVRRNTWQFALFLFFVGGSITCILLLMSFFPPCVLEGDEFSKPLYESFEPQPSIVPQMNVSAAANVTLERLRVDKFYADFYANVTQKTYRIALVGDSLAGALYIGYNIVGMVSMYLPGLRFQFVPFDVSGSRIADIRARLDQVLAADVDGYFVFFDSDAYDVDEWLMSKDEVAATQATYRANLEYVLRTLNAAKPHGFLALAGPSVAGEGPLFGPVTLWEYYLKYDQLDRYNAINWDVASSLHVLFLNVRRSFLQYKSDYYHNRVGYFGCLTADGNHENPLGATIVVNLLSRALLLWLTESQHIQFNLPDIHRPAL